MTHRQHPAINAIETVAAAVMGRPLVEILHLDRCPNHEAARALVEHVSSELGLESELRMVNVPGEQAARRPRFPGSPTIYVEGRGVDPSAAEREEYVLCWRVYRPEAGFSGLRPRAGSAMRSSARPQASNAD